MRGQMPAFDGTSGKTASIGPRMVATSGSIAAGATADATVAHGVGTSEFEVVGHLEDGSASEYVQWKVLARTDTAVTVRFLNTYTAVASAVLRFRLIY